MNMVVTEADTMGSDISWSELGQLGKVQLHPWTAAGAVAERLRDADIAIINKAKITSEVLAQCPKLKLICLTATGHDCVDKAATKAKGVSVSNVPEYGAHSVAQFAWSLILELANRVGQHDRAVRAGEWGQAKVFCLWKTPQVELFGKTLGLIGAGRIGTQVAQIALAFGLKVVGLPGPSGKLPPGIEPVSLDELLAQSDIVSLHCPLTDKTKHIINKENLAKMKPGAWLINTARGGLIDDAALKLALGAGKPAFAALDVLITEPPPADHPLLGLPNCLITPHMAWTTAEARRRLMAETVANVRAFVEGKPRNLVG